MVFGRLSCFHRLVTMAPQNQDRLAKELGRRIRVMRRNKELTQSELAGLAWIDDTYISGVERGKRHISVEVLVQIANALGTTSSALLKDIETLLDFDVSLDED
jgi:transcriptional regulator with XRE-family HTH domain